MKRAKRAKKANGAAFSNLRQYISDVLFLVVSYIISYFATSKVSEVNSITSYVWILLSFSPLWIFSMNRLGMYDVTTFKYRDRVMRNVLFSTLISGIYSVIIIEFIKADSVSGVLLSVFVLISTLILLFERNIYSYLARNSKKTPPKKIIVIGLSEITKKFIYYINKTDISFTIVGTINLDDYTSLKDIKTLEFLNSVLKEQVVDEVVFTVPAHYIGDIENYALMCEEMGVTISMVLEFFDFKISNTTLTRIGTLPMLTFHTVCLNPFQLFLKRSIDIIGASIGLIVTAILSIFIVPAIKLDSEGPVLFAQNRVGLSGRIFKLYKFRSMVSNAEEKKKELLSQNQVSGNLMFKVKNDPRITKIGKFLRATSLDELPQFINILKGDMSLVGTRPPTVDEVPKYENHHWRRMSVKPGLTGLWQVSGRSSITDFDDVVKLDTQYIDEWSVWLDIKILFKTVLVVFKRKGAF